MIEYALSPCSYTSDLLAVLLGDMGYLRDLACEGLGLFNLNAAANIYRRILLSVQS